MLTPKQEAFAQAVSSGLSQSDAYKSAYSTGNQKPETISNNAYKLANNNDVITRLAELRNALAEKLLWTREDSLKTLIAVINAPDNAGNIISSVQAINKMQGFDAAEKHEHSGNLNVSITIRGR